MKRVAVVTFLAILMLASPADAARAKRPAKAKPVADGAPAAASLPALLPFHSPGTGPVLSLGEAVRTARSRSLSARTSQEKLLGVNIQRQLAVDNSWPSFGASVAANYTQLPADSPLMAFLDAPGGGGIVGFPAPGAVVDTTVHASQTLFDGFRLRDALAIADDQLALGRLDVSRSQDDAMANAAVAYFGVLRAEGLSQVAASAVQQAQQHLKLGQQRLDIGTGTRAEVLTLRAQLAQAQGQLIQARNGATTARLQLDKALNVTTAGRPLASTTQVPDVSIDLDREINEGLMRRVEVQSQILKQHLDLGRASLAGRAYWPTVGASSSWAQRGLYQGQFTAGVALNWDIFDGFKTRDQIAAAESDAATDVLALDQTRQDLALEVRSQGLARQEARDRIVIAREGLAAADEAWRISIQRYQLGFSTTTELLDARTTLTQARNSYIQAQYDLNTAQVKLAKAIGLDMAGFLGAR